MKVQISISISKFIFKNSTVAAGMPQGNIFGLFRYSGCTSDIPVQPSNLLCTYGETQSSFKQVRHTYIKLNPEPKSGELK